MYQKAKTFGDEETAEKILKTHDPKKVKEYGRKVRNFDADVWETNAPMHMFVANMLKYTQNPHMARVLIDTSDNILVYGNPADTIWGAGVDMQDARIKEPFEWPGENRLGFLLMDVREDINETMGTL
jgi:ribA/ribD-fused uncharacterized protein